MLIFSKNSNYLFEISQTLVFQERTAVPLTSPCCFKHVVLLCAKLLSIVYYKSRPKITKFINTVFFNIIFLYFQHKNKSVLNPCLYKHLIAPEFMIYFEKSCIHMLICVNDNQVLHNCFFYLFVHKNTLIDNVWNVELLLPHLWCNTELQALLNAVIVNRCCIFPQYT